MSDRGTLPAGVLDMAPGAELAAVLDTIDRSRLNGHDAVDLARVRYRQLCSVQAAFFADLVEAGHTPPGEDVAGPLRLRRR